jgi:hypothetical protein
MGSKRATEWGSAREQLVRAAQDLLLEEFGTPRPRPEAIATALSFLDPGLVAERAGVARSAFHHHWGKPPGDTDDGLTAFQRFVGEVFEGEWGEPITTDTVMFAAAFGGSFDDLVIAMADVEYRRFDDPEALARWKVTVALALYGGSTEANLDDVMGEVVAFYELIQQRYGVRMRAPFTTRDMAGAITALIDGIKLQEVYGSPDANRAVDWVRPGTDEPVRATLVAIGVHSIVSTMTEPVDPASPDPT